MAKPKEERNMLALDYLYKKLYWLENKIEALSRGKISKRDLLIYVFVGIFIVSVYFGDVIGGFTFVLIVVTLWNAKITQGLLKQSEEASRQTKQAFEIDIFNKIVSSSSQLNAELRTAGFSRTARPPYIQNFTAGMLIALKDIDPIAFKKIGKAIEVWNKKYKIKGYTYPAETFLIALNKVRKK